MAELVRCPGCGNTGTKRIIKALTVNGEPKALYECLRCGKFFYGAQETEAEGDFSLRSE